MTKAARALAFSKSISGLPSEYGRKIGIVNENKWGQAWLIGVIW